MYCIPYNIITIVTFIVLFVQTHYCSQPMRYVRVFCFVSFFFFYEYGPRCCLNIWESYSSTFLAFNRLIAIIFSPPNWKDSCVKLAIFRVFFCSPWRLYPYVDDIEMALAFMFHLERAHACLCACVRVRECQCEWNDYCSKLWPCVSIFQSK